MACYLIGIETEAELRKSPLLGTIFEGFIAAEMLKSQLNAGRRRELYYFRDQQGLEVDFLVPRKGGGICLIEAKASRTVTPAMAVPMLRLAASWKTRPGPKRPLEMYVVNEAPKAGEQTRTIAPGAKVASWQEFLASVL